MKLIIYNLLIFLILLLIVDNLIFYFPQLFNKNFIKLTSQRTQIQYLINNSEDTNSVSKIQSNNIKRIFDEYIFYHKNIDSSEVNIFDSFGYPNPKGIIDNSPEIIILGDSFAESPIFVNSLRQNLKQNIYTMGVSGQGIFHWYYHLKRYYESNYFKEPPKLIILNYYEGNDIRDSLRAERIVLSGFTNSIYYPTNPVDDKDDVFRKFSFFHELYLIFQKLKVNFFSKTFLTKEKNNNLEKNNNITERECLIFFDPYEVNTKNYFDPSTDYSKKIIKQIKQLFTIIDKNKTKIIFSYIPNTRTIYSDSKKIYNDYKFSSNNFKNFFSKDFVFFDATEILIKKSKKEKIHNCNISDIHFSDKGYELYANLLSLKVKEILD